MDVTHTDRLAAPLADRYTIEREVGQGGMATVYLAEDLKHHRKVAIKVLRPELHQSYRVNFAVGNGRFLLPSDDRQSDIWVMEVGRTATLSSRAP